VNLEGNKERYISLWQTVNRRGVDRLLEWLEGTDFYEAPCSTRYHLATKGGLCLHSLNVYDCVCKLREIVDVDVSEESLVVVALAHDLCKAGFYKESFRWHKNEDNKWEQVPVYIVEDKYPLGHGEKSLDIASTFIPLSKNERLAIRWHMGGWTEGDWGTSQAMGRAADMTPLVTLLQMADMMASSIVEAGM
jgi:hypothetical protein